MSAPFQPADGQRARWRYCYDLVMERKPGEDVTVDEVCELLDVDSVAAWAAMREAKKHLEEDKQQTVRTQNRFGWVIIDARASLAEIEKRRKKAARAVTGNARLIVSVQSKRHELSQIERSRLDFETRNTLGSQSLFSRKPKSFAELEREAKKKSTPELPFRTESEGA